MQKVRKCAEAVRDVLAKNKRAMSVRGMTVVKFRHAPMFEERLCTACQRKGDPEPYWPADSEFWPRVNGLLDFRMCKACRAEAVMRSAQREAA